MPELLVVATTSTLDSRDLVRALQRRTPIGVGVTSAPGLLAPAGELLVREAARGRGSIVVALVPGGPDLVNHALLTLESARAVGMPVAAVVVAGPGGADQRAILRAKSHVDVVELADLRAPHDDVESWPVEEWAAKEPTTVDGSVALAPYAAWESRPLPDPRNAGREVINPVLTEIVQTEGPVLAGRAYRLYVRASGGKALTTIARAPLSSGAYRLRQQGLIELSPADENPGQEDDVLRVAGSPAVRLRELGPRALDEVPLSEIAELMTRLRAAGGEEHDLPRRVLDAYGLTRMTSKAEAYLERARTWLEPA